MLLQSSRLAIGVLKYDANRCRCVALAHGLSIVGSLVYFRIAAERDHIIAPADVLPLSLFVTCLRPLDVLCIVALPAYRFQVVRVQSSVPVGPQWLDVVDSVGRCDPSGTLALLAQIVIALQNLQANRSPLARVIKTVVIVVVSSRHANTSAILTIYDRHHQQ